MESETPEEKSGVEKDCRHDENVDYALLTQEAIKLYRDYQELKKTWMDLNFGRLDPVTSNTLRVIAIRSEQIRRILEKKEKEEREQEQRQRMYNA